METTIMGYVGIIGYILGFYKGRLEKNMETTIMDYIGDIGYILGFYKGRMEHGNYNLGWGSRVPRLSAWQRLRPSRLVPFDG